MDIALMSMAISQGKIQEQASLSVMKMAMGNIKQDGNAIQTLLDATETKALQYAAQPHLGGTIDLKL